MSLSTALNIAQNSLFNTQRHTSVVSRNVADANNPNYARRSVHMASLAPGAQIAEVRRSTNESLMRQSLLALSGFSAQDTILSGLNRLSTDVNGADQASSAAKALSDFQQALQFYSANASSATLAAATVESARGVVRTLNESSFAIQNFRTELDGQIDAAAKDMNRLLADLEKINSEIVAGTRLGRDINDALDTRDGLLGQIAEYIPISVVRRPDGDVMVVTGDGTMLFDKVARQVSFDRTDGYNAQTIGNGILIDGVPVSMGVGGNTTASGTISAMLQLRDTVAPAMQLQLDEMTRALNDAIPGLMTWSGDINDAGIAGRVRLNADIDPAAGGNPLLLRDGILANGNVDGNASFSDVLIGYLEAFEQPRPFTTASGATAVFSLTNYAADAISWLEANRQEASRGIDTKSALLMRTNSALSNATQVNVDEEMALLLELENSYAASARILQTIDRMLAALLDAAR